MNIVSIKIDKPGEVNFILGQSHFIKTVEDLYEALMNCVPGIQFGIAFCEASGKRLIRWTGTNDKMIELAKKAMREIAAGHVFIIFVGEGFFPLNVLPSVNNVPEACHIFCATANRTEVLGAETELGRGVLGVIDGEPPVGVEADEDIVWRKSFLRMIGYKEK